MEVIAVVDAGTSSLRASLLNRDGAVIHTAQREYTPQFLPNGNVVQEAETWRTALFAALREAQASTENSGVTVTAISVTSQRASIIPVGSKGEPLCPAIMWQDKRSVTECAYIEQELSAPEIYRRTGLRVDPYFSAAKILWLERNEPSIRRAAVRLIGVQDWIAWLLTGRYVTDSTQACRTMLMDVRTRRWDPDLLSVVGVRESELPEIVEPGTIVGGLTQEAAAIAGLRAGIPVVLAGGDQQNAALALDVFESGSAEANTGTGSFLIAYSPRPAFDPQMRTLCSCGAVPGTWVIEAGLLTTGIVYSWAKSQFYREATDQDAIEMMNREAEASPAGSNGLFVLPHFKGAAAPRWNPLATGLFAGVRMDTVRGDFARAILEGIAMELGENLAVIETLTGRINAVSVAGGLVRSDLFNRIQAGCFGRPVRRYRNSEASTLGALMNAGVALGHYPSFRDAFTVVRGEEPTLFEPDEQTATVYRKLKMRVNLIYEAMSRLGVYEELAKPLDSESRTLDRYPGTDATIHQ